MNVSSSKGDKADVIKIIRGGSISKSVIWNVRRKEFENGGFKFIVVGCKREGRANNFESRMKVIFISSKLSSERERGVIEGGGRSGRNGNVSGWGRSERGVEKL